MAKEELLKVAKKDVKDLDNLELLNQMLAVKKEEFKLIQGKITQYKTQIVTLENRLMTMESEFNNKISIEKKEFENTRQTKLNDLTNRDEILRRSELELTRRKIAIEEQENMIEKARVEKNNLINERLKFEKLNSEAQSKHDEAIRVSDEAINKLNQASEKEVKADNNLKEVQHLKSMMDVQQEELDTKAKDIETQINNLLKLREEVNPKIEEYNKLVKTNQFQLEEIKEKTIEVDSKFAESEKLFESAQQKAKENRQKEIELATKEKELNRREALLNQ